MKRIVTIAISIFLLSGCAETFKRIEQEEAQRNAKEASIKSEIISRIVDAQVKGFVLCTGKDRCDKAFKLTKLYILQNSDYKIERSDEMSISTHSYNPYNRDRSYQIRFEDLVYMNAVRIPVKGGNDSEKIVLTADCGKHYDTYSKEISKCVDSVINAYNGFAPFVESQL